ncbi:uncharacterized protein METZ01_LOCUS339176 [marine metagenome]|uniref:Uncharacterized protein n=1 Tax=marine metagenome TaxID=408172 RepID=A0A382QNK0_9ZZZZ
MKYTSGVSGRMRIAPSNFNDGQM